MGNLDMKFHLRYLSKTVLYNILLSDLDYEGFMTLKSTDQSIINAKTSYKVSTESDPRNGAKQMHTPPHSRIQLYDIYLCSTKASIFISSAEQQMIEER